MTYCPGAGQCLPPPTLPLCSAELRGQLSCGMLRRTSQLLQKMYIALSMVGGMADTVACWNFFVWGGHEAPLLLEVRAGRMRGPGGSGPGGSSPPAHAPLCLQAPWQPHHCLPATLGYSLGCLVWSSLCKTSPYTCWPGGPGAPPPFQRNAPVIRGTWMLQLSSPGSRVQHVETSAYNNFLTFPAFRLGACGGRTVPAGVLAWWPGSLSTRIGTTRSPAHVTL